jgi:hypothetical protein
MRVGGSGIQGHVLFHWRWPIEYKTILQDGLPPMFISKPHLTTMLQRGEPDVDIRIKIKDKLKKVLAKGYLTAGPLRSLTSFFSVPKGITDVHIVYNGTKSRLNDCLCALWFRLPTVEQHL